MTEKETEKIKSILSRKNAIDILNQLVKLKQASKYDLRMQLLKDGVDLSYATVLNYIKKFKELGLVAEIGEVEAQRGGTKILYQPTDKAINLISEVQPSKIAPMAMQSTESPSILGFYSLGMPKSKKQTINQKKEIQKVLKDMRVDVAIVINYNNYPIPVVPISSMGGIDQISKVFSEELSKRILSTAINVAQNIAEQKKES